MYGNLEKLTGGLLAKLDHSNLANTILPCILTLRFVKCLKFTFGRGWARFIRRISAVSIAIQTKDKEENHLIIYFLNCIGHGRNATYEPGLISYYIPIQTL